MADTAAAICPEKPAGARFFRFLELLGAAVLVGGLGAAAAIGSTAFGSPDLLTHEQAGRFMARVFEGSIFAEVGAVGLILVARVAGRRCLKAAVLPLIVLLGFAGGHVSLASQMRSIRVDHGGSLEALAKDHPDRARFGKLHGIYNVLALGLLGFGLAVLWPPAAAGAAKE